VTHEHDIADYHKRVIEVRDGRILRDHPVEGRHVAAEDLRRLDAEGPGVPDVPEVPDVPDPVTTP
jgi:hypothetical protein